MGRKKCNCNKEVNMDQVQDNFEYVGCDDKDNPTFQCKDCGTRVCG